jgi:hypothetical protein
MVKIRNFQSLFGNYTEKKYDHKMVSENNKDHNVSD